MNKYWKTGNEIYIGVPIGGAIELTEEEYNVLQEGKMVIAMKAKRDSLISSIEWRRSRHNDEVALGLEPTEPLLPILEYIQGLRNITGQIGFPTDIVWPIAP